MATLRTREATFTRHAGKAGHENTTSTDLNDVRPRDPHATSKPHSHLDYPISLILHGESLKARYSHWSQREIVEQTHQGSLQRSPRPDHQPHSLQLSWGFGGGPAKVPQYPETLTVYSLLITTSERLSSAPYHSRLPIPKLRCKRQRPELAKRRQ